MERFSVIYRLTGNEAEAMTKAQDICLEQTVEFPGELIPDGIIKEHVVGRITDFKGDGPGHFLTIISFVVESAANELTQLLNVVFGNISIKPGFRVEEILLPKGLTKAFNGPRFGRVGLRERLGVQDRPLLFTALKPMGLSSRDLADLAHKFALGGIDIIKDDHGLTDQTFAPFEERTALCAEAVDRANRETGQQCIYVSNITAPYGDLMKRAYFAKQNGAGGLLIAPGLVGFDTMRALADDDQIDLPVFSHPAFLGSFVTSPDNGIAHYALFGQITRLAGGDGSIYPNYGGRFSFSREECASIARGTEVTMQDIKTIFPCPGGGMSIDNIPDMMRLYGNEVVFLVGGGLFRQGPNIIENCRYFRSLVESAGWVD